LGRRLVAIALGLALHAPPAAALDVGATVEALRTLRAAYAAAPDGLPTRFETRLTAWQETPRWLVVTGDRPPDEPEPHVLTHPLFVFGWPDGRRLLVDAGLPPEEARGFGRPSELLGAETTVCGTGAFDGLAPGSIAGVVLTHLHVDHLLGLAALCTDGARLPVRIPVAQRESDERFAAAGRERLEELARAGCVEIGPLELETDPPTAPGAPGLAGFRGVHRVAVPGHTPGSQLLVGFVGAPGGVRGVVLSGDVVNHRAGYRLDEPKPWLYRRLLVREVDALQERNRALLARLEEADFEILVSHDLGIPEGSEGAACP